MSIESTETAVRHFPCSACGAKLEFSPGAEELACPYCGHTESVPQSEDDIEEIDFHAALQSLEQESETVTVSTVTCGGCGAVVDSPENTASFACPYCDSPIVVEAQDDNRIKPKSLLPFSVERTTAQQQFKDWIGSLWFAPNDLKQRSQISEHLHGMYIPFWTYDAYTTTFYRGQRGDNYTETYTVNGETKTRTKTRWRSVSGVIYENFDDVLINASESLPRRLADELEPWDLDNLVPYNKDYLAGFATERYQLGLEEGFDHAQERMNDDIVKLIKRDIGGDKQRIDNTNTNYRNVSFKHILLPVWIAAYRYNETPYRFLVNARTGEVQGERPYSWIKITLAIAAVIAVIAGLVLAFG